MGFLVGRAKTGDRGPREGVGVDGCCHFDGDREVQKLGKHLAGWISLLANDLDSRASHCSEKRVNLWMAIKTG